jgi:hypothetical protein
MDIIHIITDRPELVAEGDCGLETNSVPFELDYQFEYGNRVYAPFPVISLYAGPFPRHQEVVLFSGTEAAALRKAGLPTEVWRVRQVVFDFANGATRRVSILLGNACGYRSGAYYLQ